MRRKEQEKKKGMAGDVWWSRGGCAEDREKVQWVERMQLLRYNVQFTLDIKRSPFKVVVGLRTNFK